MVIQRIYSRFLVQSRLQVMTLSDKYCRKRWVFISKFDKARLFSWEGLHPHTVRDHLPSSRCDMLPQWIINLRYHHLHTLHLPKSLCPHSSLLTFLAWHSSCQLVLSADHLNGDSSPSNYSMEFTWQFKWSNSILLQLKMHMKTRRTHVCRTRHVTVQTAAHSHAGVVKNDSREFTVAAVKTSVSSCTQPRRTSIRRVLEVSHEACKLPDWEGKSGAEAARRTCTGVI